MSLKRGVDHGKDSELLMASRPARNSMGCEQSVSEQSVSEDVYGGVPSGTNLDYQDEVEASDCSDRSDDSSIETFRQKLAALTQEVGTHTSVNNHPERRKSATSDSTMARSPRKLHGSDAAGNCKRSPFKQPYLVKRARLGHYHSPPALKASSPDSLPPWRSALGSLPTTSQQVLTVRTARPKLKPRCVENEPANDVDLSDTVDFVNESIRVAKRAAAFTTRRKKATGQRPSRLLSSTQQRKVNDFAHKTAVEHALRKRDHRRDMHASVDGKLADEAFADARGQGQFKTVKVRVRVRRRRLRHEQSDDSMHARTETVAVRVRRRRRQVTAVPLEDGATEHHGEKGSEKTVIKKENNLDDSDASKLKDSCIEREKLKLTPREVKADIPWPSLLKSRKIGEVDSKPTVDGTDLDRSETTNPTQQAPKTSEPEKPALTVNGIDHDQSGRANPSALVQDQEKSKTLEKPALTANSRSNITLNPPEKPKANTDADDVKKLDAKDVRLLTTAKSEEATEASATNTVSEKSKTPPVRLAKASCSKRHVPKPSALVPKVRLTRAPAAVAIDASQKAGQTNSVDDVKKPEIPDEPTILVDDVKKKLERLRATMDVQRELPLSEPPGLHKVARLTRAHPVKNPSGPPPGHWSSPPGAWSLPKSAESKACAPPGRWGDAYKPVAVKRKDCSIDASSKVRACRAGSTPRRARNQLTPRGDPDKFADAPTSASSLTSASSPSSSSKTTSDQETCADVQPSGSPVTSGTALAVSAAKAKILQGGSADETKANEVPHKSLEGQGANADGTKANEVRNLHKRVHKEIGVRIPRNIIGTETSRSWEVVFPTRTCSTYGGKVACFEAGQKILKIQTDLVVQKPSTWLKTAILKAASDSDKPIAVPPQVSQESFSYILDWFRHGEIWVAGGASASDIMESARVLGLPKEIIVNGYLRRTGQPPSLEILRKLRRTVENQWTGFNKLLEGIFKDIEEYFQSVGLDQFTHTNTWEFPPYILPLWEKGMFISSHDVYNAARARTLALKLEEVGYTCYFTDRDLVINWS